MKKINKKKLIVLILALIAISGVGITLAYFISSTEYENEFNSKKFDVVMEENFGDDWGTKIVKFTNNESSTPVFIRVRISEEFISVNGVYLPYQVNGVDYVTKGYTSTWTNDFITLDDGWSYYKKVLSAEDTITILESINKNTSIWTTEYSNSEYNMDIAYEAIQATCDAAKELWSVTTCTLSGTDVTWGL